MKNLLLLLLLANILYFLWGRFAAEPPQPGVAIVDESDLGPALEVTADRSAQAVASVGAVLGSGEPSDLEAVVGRSCVTVGPFRASADADSAQTRYSGEGMRAGVRSAVGQIFVGHWVQIRNVGSRASGNEMLGAACTLADSGTMASLIGSGVVQPVSQQQRVIGKLHQLDDRQGLRIE